MHNRNIFCVKSRLIPSLIATKKFPSGESAIVVIFMRLSIGSVSDLLLSTQNKNDKTNVTDKTHCYYYWVFIVPTHTNTVEHCVQIPIKNRSNKLNLNKMYTCSWTDKIAKAYLLLKIKNRYAISHRTDEPVTVRRKHQITLSIHATK